MGGWWDLYQPGIWVVYLQDVKDNICFFFKYCDSSEPPRSSWVRRPVRRHQTSAAEESACTERTDTAAPRRRAGQSPYTAPAPTMADIAFMRESDVLPKRGYLILAVRFNCTPQAAQAESSLPRSLSDYSFVEMCNFQSDHV